MNRPLAFIASLALASATLIAQASSQSTTDRQALLALHEKVMAAHRASDVEMLLADETADYVVASRGEVTRPSVQERRERLGPYLGRTRFSEYRDLVPPSVEVSADGTLGWVVVQVTGKGMQTASDGSSQPLEFTSAWIELYRKVDGVWKRTGNVSNFKE